MNEIKNSPDISNGKTPAIIAHITIVGWVVAIVLNKDVNSEFAKFYIRQTLGIMLLGLFSFIPILGFFIAAATLVLWIVSLVNAANDKTEPVPVVGPLFQDWFSSL